MDKWEIVATVSVVIAVSLSFYEIIQHMLNFNKPYLQRYIIRILLIVPIYSMNAWIAMLVPSVGLYLDSLREVYESFVIYSFMKYLLNFLHYDTNLQQYIDHKPAPRHLIPFCCLPNCEGGRRFMLRCKHGILQYVVIRPITTLIAFISQLFNFYGEQNYNPFSGYTYPVLLIINNLSQFTAMYSLIIFYTGYQQELHPMSPLSKFLSIKLVVFFSFFQSVLISGLMEIEAIELTFRDFFPGLEDKIMLSRKVQEVLVCLDMLIASVGHMFAFSYRPYVENDDRSYLNRSIRSESQNSVLAMNSCCDAFCNLFDFADEKNDIREHIGQIFERIKCTFTRGQPLPTVVSVPSNPFNQRTSRENSNEKDSNLMTASVKSINGSSANKNYHSLD